MPAKAKTLTQQDKEAKLMALCKMQAQVDKLKEELRPFMIIGETVAGPYGKLTLCDGANTRVFTKEAKAEIELLKNKLEAKGQGWIEKGAPSLRLTLNKHSAVIAGMRSAG